MTKPTLRLLPERPAGAGFSARERAWHWIQTALLLLLPTTGFALHFPEWFAPVLGFARAVSWHSALGALLWTNVVLGLLYYVAAGRWPRVLPAPGDFTGGALRLLRYYAGGFLRGEPHPFQGHETPLGPVARASYLSLLLLLIPLQMVTGAVTWCVNRRILPAEGFLGLPILGPAHTLGAYLFVASLILHVYLTTLAPGTRDRLRAMLPGSR